MADHSLTSDVVAKNAFYITVAGAFTFIAVVVIFILN